MRRWTPDDTVWLTGLDYDVLTCARESWGILPYLVEHKRPDGQWPSKAEVTAAVLLAVERGWVEVHRLDPWTSPEGKSGAQYSDPIAHSEVPALLADSDVWDEPEGDDAWIGEVTLSRAPGWSVFLAGRKVAILPGWKTS